MKFSSLKDNLFIILLISVSLAFFWIIRPYLGAIFWAAVLAIIFYPLQRVWLRVFAGQATISALVTLLSIFFAVLVPMYFLGDALVRESIGVYQKLNASQGAVVRSIGQTDLYGALIERLEQIGIDEVELKVKVSSILRTIAQHLVSRAAEAGQNTLTFVVRFFIMFYLLFFFLRDGVRLLEKFSRFVPLGDKKEKRLFEKFVSTSRATLKGTLIIGVVQGIIGGITFWIAGLGAPVLWGGLMTLLSIIPAVGSVLIWAPAGGFLLLTGHVWQGVMVLGVGVFIISLVDNVLRPPLIGRDTEMPQAMILLSTLGGISVYGISGFVIGPIIAAFFLSMWDMFEETYHSNLTRSG